MQDGYYQNKVYPFQDKILEMVDGANVDFYLTGGTALSRFYLNHRYSDDLDFFVNNHAAFNEQCKQVLSGLERERNKYEA